MSDTLMRVFCGEISTQTGCWTVFTDFICQLWISIQYVDVYLYAYGSVWNVKLHFLVFLKLAISY